MSYRNSPAAIIHMLQTVGCSRILTTPGGHNNVIDTLISSVHEGCPSDMTPSIEYIPSPDLMYLHMGGKDLDTSWKAYSPKDRSLDDVCLYLHSSGSTGFPKSIPTTFHTMRAAMNMGEMLFVHILLLVT
jgi:long-subunit acyl-CoA synthetase (AMP-forming)